MKNSDLDARHVVSTYVHTSNDFVWTCRFLHDDNYFIYYTLRFYFCRQHSHGLGENSSTLRNDLLHSGRGTFSENRRDPVVLPPARRLIRHIYVCGGWAPRQ
jgi:hypothetical protein